MIDIIDDAVFYIGRLFIGFIQWVYVIPLLYYAKSKVSKSFLVGLCSGAILLTLLNAGLIIRILTNPSGFI